MDAKKLIEYGVLAIVGWFILTWLLGTIEGAVAQIGAGFNQPDYQAPLVYPQYFLYSGGGQPVSPVRWGGGRPRPGDGRQPGTGGF